MKGDLLREMGEEAGDSFFATYENILFTEQESIIIAIQCQYVSRYVGYKKYFSSSIYDTSRQ